MPDKTNGENRPDRSPMLDAELLAAGRKLNDEDRVTLSALCGHPIMSQLAMEVAAWVREVAAGDLSIPNLLNCGTKELSFWLNGAMILNDVATSANIERLTNSLQRYCTAYACRRLYDIGQSENS